MIRFDPEQPRVIKRIEDIAPMEVGRNLLRVSRVNPASPPLDAGVLAILTFLRERYEQWRDDQVNCCEFFPDVLEMLQSQRRRGEFETFVTRRLGRKGWELATDLLIVAAWHAFQSARDRM